MYVFKNSKNNYFVLTLKLRSPPRLELLMVNLHKPMAINSHHFKLQYNCFQNLGPVALALAIQRI